MGIVGKDLTKHVYDLLPAVASELFTTKVMLPTMNVVVSNVRGPDMPMYLAGAQMVAFAPVSIAMNGLGLNVTGFSYHGTLWMCAAACRDMMPDPGFFADCLRASFADLVAAADSCTWKLRGRRVASKPARKACARPRASRCEGRGKEHSSAARRRPEVSLISSHVDAAWQQRNGVGGCQLRARLASLRNFGYE